uniref:Uncharacterized protein n=1 Tax=Heterorhabditis bacteriophora TaxID=37862 RepID=A0A1I7WHH6_HETBA
MVRQLFKIKVGLELFSFPSSNLIYLRIQITVPKQKRYFLFIISEFQCNTLFTFQIENIKVTYDLPEVLKKIEDNSTRRVVNIFIF